MKVIMTVLTLTLSMPVLHAVLSGVADIGEATFYYWVFGIPILLVAVPLVGLSLEKCVRIAGFLGFPAILASTLIWAILGALVVSRADRVIWQVIAVGAIFAGIGGLTWSIFDHIAQNKKDFT